MENKADLLELLIEKAEEYGKTSYELLKLKVIDKSSEIMSSILSGLIVTFTIFFAFILINIGLALWLGYVLGNSWYGFFCLAIFYVIAGLLMQFVLSRWVKKLFSNILIKIVLK